MGRLAGRMTPGHAFTLNLAGYRVNVEWRKGLEDYAECAGRWDPDKRLIELDADLTPTEAKETLIHECVHAVSDLYDLDLEESQVRILGLGLHQMLTPFIYELAALHDTKRG